MKKYFFRGLWLLYTMSSIALMLAIMIALILHDLEVNSLTEATLVPTVWLTQVVSGMGVITTASSYVLFVYGTIGFWASYIGSQAAFYIGPTVRVFFQLDTTPLNARWALVMIVISLDFASTGLIYHLGILSEGLALAYGAYALLGTLCGILVIGILNLYPTD